ncbi:hypothetical protein [Dyella mobilis]|uniref:DUF2884 family protein n=1 Tax=Dyella mobilis TaxID=1849582 RepID=A0ABS2KIJ1_9GAMM|nr:hypothetical protein [Dyella mobilis]MBM7130904.1 hypothetical protein [Dyella mobilis]GLQ97533.1 hypothetical protein GCM10007863_19530 [Dyella mobilis]
MSTVRITFPRVGQITRLATKTAVVSFSLALCTLLAACSGSNQASINSDGDFNLHGSIQAHDGYITLRASSAPDATISANGDLKINDQAVTVDPAVRALLQSYYQNALMVRNDGIATGKAGAAVGAQALKSVASGLASGHTDQIQQQVEAKAQTVKQAALKICQDLGSIQLAQDQLVAQLPAFKPYGQIVNGGDVNDCKKDIYVN